MAVKKTKEAEVEPLVYVGPSVPTLTSGTTYIGGTPPHIEADLKAFPTLAKMFVKTSELPQTLANLDNPASAESAFYNATTKYFSEVK